jgi:hypothetical protein
MGELEAIRERGYGNVYHQDLVPEQEEAVEAAVSGGVVAYLHRLVEGHEFRFHWNAHTERVGVSVCSCGDPVCHMAYVRLHIDRLISDYERKVEDFAAETRRADAALAEVERLRGENAAYREVWRVLRDQSVIIAEDGAVFERIAKWTNAPSNTASAALEGKDGD